MPGTGPSIWEKHNPSLTLRLNKGKLQCPSRKSLYENRSCAVPLSGVYNHRLQGTNRMTFHSLLSPAVTGWLPGCQTVGGFLFSLCGTVHLHSLDAERNTSSLHTSLQPSLHSKINKMDVCPDFRNHTIRRFLKTFCIPSFPLEPPAGWHVFMLVTCLCLLDSGLCRQYHDPYKWWVVTTMQWSSRFPITSD